MLRISRKDLADKLIWLLTVFMLACFYLFRTYTWGRYVQASVSVLVALIQAARNRWRLHWRPNAFTGFVLLFAAYCLTTSLWAWDPEQSVATARTLIDILICYTLLITYYEDKSVDRLFSVIKWGGFVVAFYTFFFYGGVSNVLNATQSIADRLGNAFDNVNTLGMLMAVVIVIQVYELLYDGWKWSALLSIPVVIILFAYQSRTALVLAVVGTVLVVVLKNIDNKSFLRSFFRVLGVLILVIAAFMLMLSLRVSSALEARMEGLIAWITGTGTVDSSFLARQTLVQIGLTQFLKSPIGGIGIGSSYILVGEITGHAYYLHNNFVELLACGGILGFGLYYAMYVFLIVWLIRLRKYDARHFVICIAFVLALLISDYGDVSYYDKERYFYLMMLFIEVDQLRMEQKHHNRLAADSADE